MYMMYFILGCAVAPAGYYDTCEADVDCRQPWSCIDGRCSTECEVDTDCPHYCGEQARCQDGVCDPNECA
jgi:hypothetical protein